MPTYEYVCASCGRRTEAVQKFSDPPLTECPHCGGSLKRVFHPVGIVLKGSGFYSTENRSGKKPASKPSDSGSSSSSSSDSGSSSGSGSSGSGSGSGGSGSGGSGSSGGSRDSSSGAAKKSDGGSSGGGKKT